MIRKSRLYFSFIHSASQRFTSSQSARQENELKDVTKPEKVPQDFWKKLLWVAMDLKKAVNENDKNCLKLLETKHITLLFAKPSARFQTAFTLACDLLGARKTVYYDAYFENQPNPADSGKVLSRLTDMFVIHGLHHDVLVKLASEATVPVFSASCNIYCLQKALSDLMTIQERYAKLKGLTFAWVGPPNPIFNSYLLLCHQLGINIQYICICAYGSGRMSPAHRFPGKKLCDEDGETLIESRTLEEVVTGAHVIATSMHPEEKNKIHLQLLENSDKNWIFIHTLPRTSKEVTDEIFNHERNFSWKSSENYLYVAMAVILVSLSDYEPKFLKMPDFDGKCSN